MDQIEIIVTQADSTPTSSSIALNVPATITASTQNIELQFNSQSKPNMNNNQHIKRNRNKPQTYQITSGTSINSNFNNSDESKKPLLPSSPSSSSLQLTKKVTIVPSSLSTSPIRLNLPSKFITFSFCSFLFAYEHYVNDKISFNKLGNNNAANNSKVLHSSTEPSSTSSPISSSSPTPLSNGARSKQYHSMKSVRSGEFT